MEEKEYLDTGRQMLKWYLSPSQGKAACFYIRLYFVIYNLRYIILEVLKAVKCYCCVLSYDPVRTCKWYQLYGERYRLHVHPANGGNHFFRNGP